MERAILRIWRMIQPDELKKDEPLKWSPGRGTDVWAMFSAAIAGDLQTIERLVSREPALVRSHYAYRTPLYFAVRENRIEVARFLLAQSADPLSLAVNDSFLEITRDRGYREMESLLESYLAGARGASTKGNLVAAAIRERNLEKVKSLLDASPDLLHAGDERSNQPVHWAVMTRQIDILDELLARGADIDAQRSDGARPIHLSNGDYHYRGWRDVPEDTEATPAAVLAHVIARGARVDIFTAAHRGDLDRVRALLDQDPSLVNRLSDYNSYYLGCGSPLRNAAAKGHIEIVRLLLERGADPNLPEEGIAPHGHALYSAVYNRHFEIARLLLENGAHPNPPVESSADALSIAMMNSDEKMIDLLVSYGAARSVEILAYYGDLRTAAAVFAANPALADDPGALANAAANGNESFVRLMLRHQPALAQRISVGAKTRELTEFLFAQGMDPSRPDWLGVTPLHEFARKGDVEKAALFIDHGAGLHARDEDICSTPLGWAAKFGQMPMVEFLLTRGAKPNLTGDPPWATPLAWATRRGHEQIAELLKQHGAR
jgi:ankyrin repeat protein